METFGKKGKTTSVSSTNSRLSIISVRVNVEIRFRNSIFKDSINEIITVIARRIR